MKIRAIQTFQVSGEGPGPWHAQECRLVRPLDVYPEFRDEDAEDRGRRTDARRRVERIFLEVATDDGPTGLYGPIDRRQAFLAATCLAPLLLGREALQVETLWDIMVRSDRHARSGHLMMAASAVDCALWDLRGKALGAPVYQLLGGPTRPRVPAYASLLFFSHQPDLLRERALEYRDRGYAAQKWFFRFGPGSGREGMAANLALVRTLRETLGEAYDLMFDAWGAWDTAYAAAMARGMGPLRPRWLEEPLPPHRLDGFVRLKRETAVPLAAGEHLFARWEVKPFLEAGVLDYVQTDPEWTGGITELVKICALAALYDVKVVPHGCGIAAALHVVASQPAWLCPMVEYLVQHLQHQQFFYRWPMVPREGEIPLPTAPGLGVDLDEAKIESRLALEWA